MRSIAFGIFWVVSGLIASSGTEPARLEGAWGYLDGKPLVPAVLGIWTDQTGAGWNLQDHAILGRIGSGMMSSGEALWLDGEAFACDEPLMTRDGGEWVFPANRLLSGLVVTRRVRLDREAGVIRYLETLRNPSAAEVTVVLELRTQFNGNIAELRSDRGRLSPLTLEPEETGIVVTPATAGHDRLLAYGLCVGNAVSRPAISAPSRFGLHVRSTLTVPAGATAIVLHGMAQRLPADSSEALDLEGLAVGLKPEERLAIANLPSPQETDPRARLMASVRKEWGDLPAQDTLWLDRENHLPGTLRSAESLDEIVAMDDSRISYRNGEVWRGSIAGAKFEPTANPSSAIELAGTKALRCVRGGLPGYAAWPPEVDAFLETQEGERWAIEELSGSPSGFTSPWGSWTGTLDDIAAFEWKDGEPWLTRRDGSRVRAFPVEEIWTIKTRRNGEMRIPLTKVRSFVHRDGSKALPAVQVRLREGEILAGDWASQGTVQVREVELLPSAIRELTRVGDDDRLRADLWDGGSVEGSLGSGSLPVIVAGREFRIRARDLAGVTVRPVVLKEAERASISADITKLGSSSWTEREAATARLAAWGIRGRGELEAAMATRKEPEILHRLQSLLAD